MRAMVLRGPNTPFEKATVPDPTPGPGEAVARVITCGAGLTIQHVKAGRRKTSFPRIIGHEITAEIVALGAASQPETGRPRHRSFLFVLWPLPLLPVAARAAVS